MDSMENPNASQNPESPSGEVPVPPPQRRYRFAKRQHIVLRPPVDTPPPVDTAHPVPPEPENVQQTRVMKKIQHFSRDTPPNLPFLRFDAIVGRGGMAVVWRAWHRELKRFVAVKVLDERFTATGQDVRQFMSEVRTMTDLHHQGIVQGYGADCVDGRYYLIMDYVDGYTFASLMNRKSRISESDAVIICESVADAMKYAWDMFQTVHCDLKPENIMVDRDGTVKVMDLGLCQSTAAINVKGNEDMVIGTPAYISPEQIYCDEELDCRADIYCLGATLYHLTTGRMLFPFLASDDILRAHVNPKIQALDPRVNAPDLSRGFTRLIAGMLVKDREWRYQTWDDVYDDAKAVEEGIELPPLPPEAISSVHLDD